MDGPIARHDLRSGEGVTSLEVRWIRAGLIPDSVLDRLGLFGDPIEQREDRYLVDPLFAELGVKIRGALELDLKAFRGSPGELDVPGMGRGRLELWEKWQFSLDVGTLPPPETSRWLAIGKLRRRRSFAFADGDIRERPVSDAWRPGCTLELTEVTAGDEPWWTVALEATGRAGEPLERQLSETAAHVLREPLPHDLQFDVRESMSYVRWLDAERTAVATR